MRSLFTDVPPNEGWGVVRSEPWDFAGLFDTEALAQAKAQELGAGYVVSYGWNEVGTSSFVPKGGRRLDA